MRKLDFCLCKNKGADQLCGNCTADQRFLFSLHGKYNSSSTYNQNYKLLACWPVHTWSETVKIGFLTSWLIYERLHKYDCCSLALVMPHIFCFVFVSLYKMNEVVVFI